MKRVKRVLALLAAFALVLAMAVPAWAEGNKGSITVQNAKENEEYKIYRIFDLESYSGNSYSYKMSTKWSNAGFATDSAFTSYFETVNGCYIKPKAEFTDETAATFAKNALAFAKKNNIEDDGYQTAGNAGVSFSSLSLGYYLLDTSLGTLCSLDTTNPAAILREKNDSPTIEKKVKENDNWDTDSNAKIGDKVEYQVTIHAKKGAENYVLTDTMDNGLTFNNDIVVKAGTNDLVLNKDYTVKTKTSNSIENTFELTFTKTYLDSLTENTTDIVVTYSATINENAVVFDTANKNTAKLKYGNNSETVPSQTNTYTYKFDLVKIDGTTKKLLSNVEFKLYEAATGSVDGEYVVSGKPIKFVKTDNTYRVAKDTTAAGVTDTIVTTDSEKVTIEGLDKKIYYLSETKPLDGYNKPNGAFSVDLTSGNMVTTTTIGKNTVVDAKNAQKAKVIENNTGAVLPSTGGMGTTVFYVVGGGLMAVAVVLLVTKKRMENKR